MAKPKTGTECWDHENQSDWPVAIIGAGTMGHGIAQVASRRCGFDVRLFDESSEALGAAKSGIERTLDKGLARGVVTREEKESTLARISFVDTLEEAVANGRRTAIEAVPEDTEGASGCGGRASRPSS